MEKKIVDRLENQAVRHLLEAGIIAPDHVSVFHPRTRDRDDLPVLRCARSGVIFLESSAHITDRYYDDKQQEDAVAKATKSETVKDADTQRRLESHKNLITGKSWLDVGCGEGRLLAAMAGLAHDAVGLEPTQWRVNSDETTDYRIITGLDTVTGEQFDVISLFHVLEHMTDPVPMVETLSGHLAANGKMIVEVPHARDILLLDYACERYRDHTFWSEHLVLHTQESLGMTLERAGLRVENITGCQRYPLANHLYWLAQGKPGGQEVWQNMSNTALDEAYQNHLLELDRTDTLVAIASRS